MPSIEQLQRLLAADPHDAFTLYAMGQELAKRGEVDKAVAFYDRSIAANPDDGYTFFHKARALQAANRVPEAIAAVRAGIAAARRVGDNKALNELSAFLDEME
ncbi:MAG TPA: tetratricopeptide repeat protein [Phycisphaerales bacterium]